MDKVKVGVIGCGNISPAYLRQCPLFEILEVVACADLLPERAKARAEEFGVPRACSVEELIADPEIEIAINLTVPKAHFEVSMRCVEAGKSVWTEKPLSVKREEGIKLVEAAKSRGVLIGCAPDTFLAGGHQTCRKLIDDGWIGEPIGATAFMLGHGSENWHPDPAFFYQVGGGPMFDMGPYYLTALINLLGPARRVCGSARISEPVRTITSQPNYGKQIEVEVPTHVVGVLDFAHGAIANIITSWDVWGHSLPWIEIYGTQGCLSVPDPNGPGGAVRVLRPGGGWMEVPHTHGLDDISRSTGVADMAYAIRSGRPHRASGELALHVLDIMHAIHEASATSRYIELTTTCERPAALPLGLRQGALDA